MPRANGKESGKAAAADQKKEVKEAEVKTTASAEKEAEVKEAPAAKKAEVKEAAAPAAKEAEVKAAPAAKPGRKAAASKKAAAPKKTEPKKTGKDAKNKEVVHLQFAGNDWEISDIVERVKAAYTGKAIKEMRIYVKPEENMVYYVINDNEIGSVEL